MEVLYPGSAHPNPPEAAEALAERFGVEAGDVRRWFERGLEVDAEGRCDPFHCCNWLSWGRLDQAPALRRRWQNYLGFFQGLLRPATEQRRISWQRQHSLHLPGPQSDLRWFVPAPQGQTRMQEVICDSGLAAGAQAFDAVPGGWLWRGACPQGPFSATGLCQLQLLSGQDLSQEDQERVALARALEEFVGGFRYVYRHHRADAPYPDPNWVSEGSCLDCALQAAAILRQQGWSCCLQGGLVARSDLLNPHFWLEVKGRHGLIQVDPSLPAIARMLDAPWRDWLHAACGNRDTCRILLAAGRRAEGGRWSGDFPSAAIGAAWTDHHDLWACTDMVCGDCYGIIRRQ